MPLLIQEQVPLAPFTTLGVGGNAAYFARVHREEELSDAVLWAEKHGQAICVIGGGSNLLVPDTGVAGLVIKNEITHVTYAHTANHTLVSAGAGVRFDDLIRELVENGYWGLENLSAIPGTVGGVPIQNVGAYGVEVREVIHEVTAYDRVTHTMVTLDNDACAFGYRDSLFKHEGKDRYVITEVTFKVSTTPNPKLAYADLRAQFEGVVNPALSDIRTAIVAIRSKKFPDWQVLGTAGSFFKNPTITESDFEALRARYPELPGYAHGDKQYKIALGWILDRVLNLKGHREGNVGLYIGQALVLVNYGGATADEIIAFSERVMEKIYDATGIRVEREVVCLT